ncbi:hypothetical protein CCR75_004752 [Bremia lactucae]|uniref:Tubulin--tyrosine ligase-like protein 5 n=1 Tax=Bremia lactucae TaxID=4779 RepID=A0A976IEF3_BRELC|nr:hypothetical protein CCR75_004752 [Bremia lactucae]
MLSNCLKLDIVNSERMKCWSTHSPVLALLLLAQAALIDLCITAITRSAARFFLPEEAQQQKLKPVLEHLEAFGILQYQPADHQASWGTLLSDSAHFDLVWSVGISPPLAQLELPYQFNAKVNHLPGAERLTSLDALGQHLAAQQHHVKFFFYFVPAHYELPRDQALLTSAYTKVLKKNMYSPKRSRDKNVFRRFLLRERDANDNNDVTQRAEVFVSDEELKLKLQSSAYKGKSVVVDQYVEPLLLDNHKFRVGFYVAVMSVDPLRVYVYNHALIQIAKSEYPSELMVDTDPSTYNYDHHIAPWDFPDLQAYFHELPSASREGTNAWQVVKKYLRKQGIDTKHLQNEVDSSIAKVVLSSRGYFQGGLAKVKRANAHKGDGGTPSDLSDSFFDFWRFEFEFDDVAKPWLVRVVPNPSLKGVSSVLGTDEAVKKGLIHDLLNLVGVYPQTRRPFGKIHRPPTNSTFCMDKCHDQNRAWDTSCWSCPGWFLPHVTRKLYDATSEYDRRGNFNLVFPSFDQELSTFLDTELSEYDIAFSRYLKSLSSSYSNLVDFPASDRAVMCVYREHCNHHGDCVNGMCSCDSNFEGRTCYIPKDINQEGYSQRKYGDVILQGAELSKDKVENLTEIHQDRKPPRIDGISGVGLGFLTILLCTLVIFIYRFLFSRKSSGCSDLPHDGKAI